MPNKRPDVTIESDAALLLGGARSPTKGSMSCGVTVVIAVIKEMAVKAPKSFVTQTPILETEVHQQTALDRPFQSYIPHGRSKEDKR
jgi:hypothetical protein